MSLATRCTACGTVFRVVQDQLKVSEGWVRCGRCNEVFNALEGLFDLERETPADWKPETPDGTTDSDGTPALGAVAREEAPGVDAQADKVDSQLQAGRTQGSTPAARVSERDRLDFTEARFEPGAAEEEEPGIDIDIDRVVISPAGSAAAAAPHFVRRAEREARWRSPAAGIALTLLALLLTAGLSLQVAHHFRDVAAARWPALRPVLTAWCDAVRCAVRPPALIDQIAVETTALARDAAPDAFRLSVTLRNHGAMLIAMPSIDLSLTDPGGNLVARRVLAPQTAAGAIAPTSIAPGAESALQWILSAGAARVTGYTVEIFYP